MEMANTTAYYDMAAITAVKRFYSTSLGGVSSIKLLAAVNCFSMAIRAQCYKNFAELLCILLR
jgi:hypothetical protein